MRYAVFSRNGKQYKASEGEEILLDHLDKEVGENVEFLDVFLVAGSGDLKIGTPKVEGAKVLAKVVGELKGDKIRVVKYKAKSRYRRATGFRHQYTKIKIEEITS